MFLSRSKELLYIGCIIIWVNSISHDRGKKKYIYQYIFIELIF